MDPLLQSLLYRLCGSSVIIVCIGCIFQKGIPCDHILKGSFVKKAVMYSVDLTGSGTACGGGDRKAHVGMSLHKLL
jgi:hypothetical protein